MADPAPDGNNTSFWKSLSKRLSDRRRDVTEEDIRELMDAGEETGVIEGSQKDMINNIFEFGDMTVEDIMTPRTEVEALDADDDTLQDALRIAVQEGFKPEAFEPFYATLRSWQPVKAFDTGDIAERLSDDFDYIGICCSLIVFIFLWISFRSIWLALIAFIPMALSWIWIFAIMQFFGLQFNIVNIILATFIFGQGDDYTIFVVEGLLYEHQTGKPMLPQYRQSILLSALIMLVGIGILVLAVHPAMHSLGVVTLIGMSIVLLMAMTIPPLLFKLYVRLSKRHAIQ